jgi:hypothetical protein
VQEKIDRALALSLCSLIVSRHQATHGSLLESLQTAQTFLTDDANKLGMRTQVPVFRFLDVADFFDRFVPT